MEFRGEISEFIWQQKYRYCQDQQVIDHSIHDTWERVAKAVAANEQNATHWQQQFQSILTDFQFLPGGRILAGAGTNLQVTLFNCFVMGAIDDSMSGIFSALHECALTLQQGGGIGHDFSTLRPKGSLAKKSQSIASGPVSFMQIWDTMSKTMQSTGARRGAMMGTLRCDHPDIEDFIAVKQDPQQLRHFNISVLVSDAFLQAVKNNDDWALVFPDANLAADAAAECVSRAWYEPHQKIPCRVFRRVKARALWEKIMQAAYDYAEPGVLFIDTINRLNNLYYCENIHTTNPCGEIPLPAYAACNLGAINLTQFVSQPFSDKAAFNWQGLQNIASTATRFLDNVIDVSQFPLTQQRAAVQATRRIGLGITGLADCLVMLGLRYDSKEAEQLAAKIMQTISETAWQMSIELAREKGSFAQLKIEPCLKGEYVQSLPQHIREGMQKYGLRNSHHTTIAPTGTISLLANNISSGIEPIFQSHYNRQVRTKSGELNTFEIRDYAYDVWLSQKHKAALPPAWIDAQQLMPNDHLQMQAVLQKYIDNAISKTIYIPEDFPFSQLQDVYAKAYAAGLKGCTVFRPNPITGSVLTTETVTGKASHCCTYGE